MIELTIANTQIFKTIFDAVASIVDEVQIRLEDEGLYLSAIDRSHITFCNLELKKDFFDEYQYEPVKLNVDTEELLKILKRSKADDILTIKADEGNLILIFEGAAKRTFKVRLIDIEYEAPSPPELEYPTFVEVPFSVFKTGLQDMEIVSDKLSIKVDPDRFFMSAEGDFGGSNFEYIHAESVNGDYKSAYSLEKIKEMLKADKFSDTVRIGIGNDMPLNLSLDCGEGKLSFLLAPRIESEVE